MPLVTDLPGEYPAAWLWLHERTNLPWSTDLRIIAHQNEAGIIEMAAAYNCFWPGGVFMHVACDRPLRRDFINAVFDYGFMHRNVLYGLTPHGLVKAHRLNRRLGFRPLIEIGGATLYALEAADAKKWLLGTGGALSQDSKPAQVARPGGNEDGAGDHGLSVAMDEVS